MIRKIVNKVMRRGNQSFRISKPPPPSKKKQTNKQKNLMMDRIDGRPLFEVTAQTTAATTKRNKK